MRPNKWQLEEAIMLIDLYFRSPSLSAKQFESECLTLSALLRNRALLLGIPVDERYRNGNGIKMRLKSVKFLVTGGNLGLNSPSKASAKALELYHTLPKVFAQLVQEFEERYSIIRE